MVSYEPGYFFYSNYFTFCRVLPKSLRRLGPTAAKRQVCIFSPTELTGGGGEDSASPRSGELLGMGMGDATVGQWGQLAPLRCGCGGRAMFLPHNYVQQHGPCGFFAMKSYLFANKPQKIPSGKFICKFSVALLPIVLHMLTLNQGEGHDRSDRVTDVMFHRLLRKIISVYEKHRH